VALLRGEKRRCVGLQGRAYVAPAACCDEQEGWAAKLRSSVLAGVNEPKKKLPWRAQGRGAEVAAFTAD